MVKQNKNITNKNTQKIETFIARVGLSAMSVAAIAGLIEMHEGRSAKVMPILQPAYAQMTENDQLAETGHEFMRREKDEIRHMSVSYGSSMRSHPTAGTL